VLILTISDEKQDVLCLALGSRLTDNPFRDGGASSIVRKLGGISSRLHKMKKSQLKSEIIVCFAN
jgi:hypothetical protein